MIAREYSNSRNITKQALAKQRILATGRKQSHSRGFIIEYDASQRARFDAGFDAYCRGASLEDLSDPVEVEGWWYANQSQALAEAEAHRQMQTDNEVEYMMYRNGVTL